MALGREHEAEVRVVGFGVRRPVSIMELNDTEIFSMMCDTKEAPYNNRMLLLFLLLLKLSFGSLLYNHTMTFMNFGIH